MQLQFAWSWVDKVTTGIQIFVSVIANIFAWFAADLDITEFIYQATMRFIPQLISDISRVLQKLLKYFNGTIILTACLPKNYIEPVIFCLYLNKALYQKSYQEHQ